MLSHFRIAHVTWAGKSIQISTDGRLAFHSSSGGLTVCASETNANQIIIGLLETPVFEWKSVKRSLASFVD